VPVSVIIGCGGLAREVYESIEAMTYASTEFLREPPEELAAVLASSIRFWSEIPTDAAPDGQPLYRPTQDDDAIVAIGDTRTRKRIMETLPVATWFCVYDQEATRRETDRERMVAVGCYVGASAVVGPNVYLGRGVVIDVGATVAHDCVLFDYSHVCPQANLCGGVEIGEGSFVGASAVVLPKVKIGAWATIGAGAVVTKNVPPGETWVGNPARLMVPRW